jgi:hypothetical protein
MEKNRNKWIFIRNGEVRGIFDDRKEAVKYFREILKKALSDFDKQEKSDEYDYAIIVPSMEFKQIEYRATYLGL